MEYKQTYQEAVDLESELRGLTRTHSKCPQYKYQGKWVAKNCHCLKRDGGNCICPPRSQTEKKEPEFFKFFK